MRDYQLVTLHSADELRDYAAAWDDLWRRSDVTVPLTRAGTVALWSDHFAKGKLHALMVFDGERSVAALPVVPKRAKGLTLTGLTNDPWLTAGDLLLDPTADTAKALGLLAAALENLPWPLARFDFVPFESPRWAQFLSLLEERAWRVSRQPSYRTGQLAITGSWHDYLMSRSGNHRRHMRKAHTRARQAGELTLRIFSALKPTEVEPTVRQALEIEDRCWKGRAGSSILRTPGMTELTLRVARQLAARGELVVTFLDIAGQPAAFELGCCAKQTYFSPKVGHDEAFAQFTPGQLLRYEQYQRLLNEQDVQQVEYWGPLTGAVTRWATGSYVVGRVIAAPPRLTSRALWWAYQAGRRLRNAARDVTAARGLKNHGISDAIADSEAHVATG